MSPFTPVLYFILQHTDGNVDVLHKFATAEEREAATIEMIYGNPENCDRDCWDKERAELLERGVLTFEGDPGLEWFHAVAAN